MREGGRTIDSKGLNVWVFHPFHCLEKKAYSSIRYTSYVPFKKRGRKLTLSAWNFLNAKPAPECE
jgi:hypothetical protein